jgi:glycosyltransferase involved in cell wall biosynthesis
MKILHIGKYYHPYLGGMETVLRNLAEGLLDAGCDFSALTSGEEALDRREVLSGPRTGRRGRLVRAGRHGVLNSQPLNPSLPGLLRREIEEGRPDLVHLHLPNPLAAFAWLALRASGTVKLPPLAVWYHADITRQRFGRYLVRSMVDSCLRQAVGVCVSSASLAGSSPVLQRSGKAVEVVPFGIDPVPWCEIRPSLDGPFLFVGRLVPYKGLDILLKAIARVPGAAVVLVGDGPLRNRLGDLADGLGLGGRVRFAGPLQQHGIASLLAGARALILASRDVSETFGLVQLEAMASGVPVVASDLPTGIREVGVDGETCLLVPPGDVSALSAALAKLQSEPRLAERLGTAGRERFNLNFTRERMVERLLRWYHVLLAERPEEGS